MAAGVTGRVLAVPVAVLVADQAVKAWLVASLPYGAQRPIVDGFCNLVHTRNRGVAFGLFAQGGALSQTLLVVVVVVLVVFVAWQLLLHRHRFWPRLGLGLILGGALGNLTDRILRGEVVDFLDVYLTWGGRTYHWPAFNLADASITVGALLLVALELWGKDGKGGYAPDPR